MTMQVGHAREVAVDEGDGVAAAEEEAAMAPAAAGEVKDIAAGYNLRRETDHPRRRSIPLRLWRMAPHCRPPCCTPLVAEG